MKLSSVIIAGLIATASPLGLSAAQATIIDFEAGSPGSQVGNTYASEGVTFSGAYFFSCGGGCPSPAFGQFASSVDFSSLFTANFSSLQSSVSFDNVTNSNVLAEAYNSSGTLVASLSDNSGGSIDPLVLTGAGISYVTFQTDGAGEFGIDDLGFNGLGAVPEPSAWLLMIAGIGGVGLMARRSKQKIGSKLKEILTV